MVKRALDIALAAAGLLAALPVIGPVALLVWLQDRRSPFYIAPRTGRGGVAFRMVKLRSMVIGADRARIDSTATHDPRITPVGRFIRATKLDEISQMWNVLRGEMSLVGPRPNVARETERYTEAERRLLTVPPGITDFASIVFADEGRILEGCADPDLGYNRLIRPWKSRLGLLYIDHASMAIDLAVIALTALALVSRRAALVLLTRLLRRLGADATLCAVAARRDELLPAPPPGATEPVSAAELSANQRAA
jgi:lipopolysaccharide/colanic/teichoic acid biosynthesis glycosyltransferase